MKNFTKKILNYTKICLLTIGLLFSGITLLAQKVAVVGLDHVGNDGFSFVATQALTAGDIIYFTNNYYNAATTRFRLSTDGVVPNTDPNSDNSDKFIAKYTVPVGGLAKGVVVYLQGDVPTLATVLTATCSSGSCGSASLIPFNGIAINFKLPATVANSIWAYSDTDDDPLNGISTIHSVLFAGYQEGISSGVTTFGSVPTVMNPTGGFPTAVVVDGLLSDFPVAFTTIEFKPGLRGGAVSKLNLEDATNYDVHVSGASTLSTTAFANLTLINANPTVSVAVSPSSVSEDGGTNLTYTFTLSANAASSITVNYTATGTATNGTDFTTLSGSVVIASGNNTTTVTVNPTTDVTLEPNETVTLTVVAGTGYDIGSPSLATATITNDDSNTAQPKIAISGINHGSATTDIESFSFAALEDITAGTIFYFTEFNYDKTLLSFTNSGNFSIKWTAPASVKRGDVFVVTEDASGGSTFTVSCSKLDGGACGSAVIQNGSSMTFTSLGETFMAFSDADIDPFNGVGQIHSVLYTGNGVTAGGGLLSATNPSSVYPNAVITDNFPGVAPVRTEYKFASGERAVSVNRTLFTNTANWIHAGSQQNVSTIRFGNMIITNGVALPLLTVNVSPNSVLENSGSSMVYTFTLSQNAASNITVNFGVSGTAVFTTDYTQTGATSFIASTGSVVIPSGSNSASVTITPVAESTLETNETVILTITTGTGYDAGSPSNATGTITNDDVRNVNPAVVIVGINHGNNTSPNPDGFSFAANQNLTAGTDIYFVNGPFDNTTLSFNSTLGFVVKYTVPAGGLAKGQVVYIVETGAATNAFTVTCSAGSTCGTATYIIQTTGTDFSFGTNGAKLYAYTDTDGDPTNGITDIHSLFHTLNIALPSIENPTAVFPNAVVVTGFGSASPDRTEYKFAASERSSTINLANIQSTANYLIGQATQGLSVIPFAALSLCPASVSTNPANASPCAGANTTFTVTATGSNLTYQWQVNAGAGFTNITNGGIYSGATSATLTLTNVPIGNNGFTYQCVVNACATSTAATLTVNALPTASPSSNTPVCVGSTLNLTSTVATTYLWSGPNTFTSSQQNPVISAVTNAAGGIYTLRITNAGGCTGTATTTVVINSTQAPTAPTATPANRTTAGSVTLSATGCSGGTLTWYDALTNVAVPSPNNQPNFSSAGTFNFYAKCTGANTCVSNASVNVSVTVTLCVPLGTTPGNVGINWTGLVSTDWNTACNWNPAWVPDATNSAVVIDLQTNQPTITGTVPTVNQIYINANAILTVSSGGTLNSNSNIVPITLQGGNIINDGTINVSGSGSSNGFAIGATASITNRGTITTNNSVGVSLQFGGLTFTNESTGIFNGDFKANNNILTLINRGTINYAGGTFALSLGSSSSSVLNTGTISITGGNGISNPSGSSITNNACGKILMSAGNYDNGGTTTNAGLIQMPNAFDFTNTGTFTNNGVVKANIISAITNNKMVITNACPIFTLGGTNSYTVSGIFTDFAATTSAGTYMLAGNKFTANNTIPTGTQTLYAQVTDGTCTFVVPFDFDNKKPTAVSINTSSICVGSNIILSATCASGTATWYGSVAGTTSLGTGSTFSYTPPLGTGQSFYVSCETTNCKSGRTMTLNSVNVNITPAAPTVTNTGPSVVCSPSTLNLIATLCAGTITWSDNSTGPSLTISAIGTYNISATCTADGCTSVASTGNNGLVIKAKPAAPTITLTSAASVCTPSTLNLTASGCAGTVTWSNAGETGTSLTLSAVGTYSITATCLDNGCLSDASNVVSGLEIKQTPAAPTVTLTSPATVCQPSTINLTASECAGTITWSDNSTGPSLTISAVGTYNVSATCTVSGCTSPSSTGNNGLAVNAPIAPNPSSDSPKCVGSTLTFNSAASMTTYAWTGPNSFSSSSQTPSISSVTTAATGTYILSVTNGACSASATTEVVINPLATAIATPSTQMICSEGAITAIAITGNGTSYTWTRDNTASVTGIAASGSGNISGSLTNTTAAPITVTFTITPVGTCNGTPITATVVVNAVPTATASSSTPTVCVGNTISLTGGGVGTYAWAGPNGYSSTAQSPTISNASVLATGTYTITVTNANSCTSTATVAVTVNANPTATASTNSPICAGTTLNLTGGGVGTAYAWTSSNGFTSTAQSPTIANATVSTSGTYTITVTNNGCTSTASVAVTVNALPTATASSNSPICTGATLNLTGGGIGTYSWMGVNGFASTDQNPSIPNASILASGTYKITVTNVNGCTSTAMTSVTVNPNPTATAGSNSPICVGNTISLTGGGIGTYSWTGVNGFASTDQNPSIPNATVLASGIYKITVTNVNGCTSTATTSVTVNPLPVVDAGANQTICEGSTASLTAICNLLTVSTTLSGASEVPANASTATGTVSGTFDKVTKQLLLTISFNGLTANASAAHLHKGAVGVNGGVQIGFSGVPATTSGSFTYTGTLTTTQEADLLAGLYYANIHNSSFPSGEIRGQLSTACVANNFVWNPGNLSGQSVTVSPTLTQTYTVTASNTTTGCSTTATTTVNVNPRPVVTIGSNTPVCVGNTLNLTSSGGTSYAWAGANGFTSTDQNPSIASVTLLATGTYTVTVTNVNGCTNTAITAVVINALPTATAISNSPICSGVTLNLTGGGIGTYAWAGPGGYSSTVQSPSIPSAIALMSGTYTVTVTNANGCTSTATTSVTVNPITATPTPQANTQIIFGASITLTATGCSGVNDVLKWYKSADNALATMPVSPTATTNFYAKCETTLNGITCISGNSVDVIVTVLQPNPPVATGATNCIGTPTTLTATGCSGSVGTFVLKWYLNATDALVTMPVSPLVSTDYYAKCEQTFNVVTAISGKSNVVTLTILNPPTPVSTGGTIYSSQSISLTATGCTGTLGTSTLKWYQTADNVLVTMPVSPTVTTQYYSKCEQTANSITCLSPKSNDVTVTVVNRIFVDIAKITAPIQNGNSWATAYGNLQTGLAAATAGVEVWVAKGTYKPTNTITRTIYFNVPNNVKVYGGFAGTEDLLSERNFRTNVSILSGDIGTQKLATDNTYHVVVLDGSSNTTILDGFTISDGYANFDPNRTYLASNALAPTTGTIETGGGILVQNGGSPTIANCTIINNAAVTGGGLYAGDASKPTITSCKIMSNQAGFGSGMYFQDGSNGKVNNTLISGNRGIGGVYNNTSNPMFTNVTFAGNGGYNGGIFNSNSQPIVKNSIIWGNSTPFNDLQSIITYSTIQGGYAGVGNLSMDPKYINPTPEGLSPSTSGDYHVEASSLTIDRGDNGTISLTDKDLDGNLRRFAGGRVDMGTYEFQGIATATLVISLATGNWESNSTWDVGRVPQLGDYVIIDNNHIVTLSTTGIAKNLEYRGTGQLKFNTTTSKLEIGF